MIETFGDHATEEVFKGKSPRRLPPEILRTAERKLRIIHAAVELRDIASPSGNRLEALKGDLKGQHSIRINDQWRICFRFTDGNAYEVRITDYHH